jgi:MFS family permease
MASSRHTRDGDPRRFPPAVWLLGWVSFLTDAASEAIYPLLPFFLARVLGGGAAALGLIEGVAEGANSLLRIVSGRLSDRWRSHRPLMIAGYALSSLVRPLIGIAGTWVHVLAVRLADRIGKGVRSAPRDALLAFWARPEDRGRIYGFHRAMDHAGAVVGPILATLFLLAAPGQYRALFLLTIVPGLIAIGLVLRVREPDVGQGSGDRPDVGQGFPPSLKLRRTSSPAQSWRRLPRGFYAYLAIVFLFTLGNSSDAFLLLRLTEAAGTPQYIPLLWSGLHVVKAGLSTVGGALSDRAGRRPVIALAWIIYAIVYGGFAMSSSFPALALWLGVYGLFFALAEGTERAYVADLAPEDLRGSAFGVFHAAVGFGSLAASILFGAVWNAFGAPAAFTMGAALALVAAVLLIMIGPLLKPSAV